jgi:hypothetical protein
VKFQGKMYEARSEAATADWTYSHQDMKQLAMMGLVWSTTITTRLDVDLAD